MTDKVIVLSAIATPLIGAMIVGLLPKKTKEMLSLVVGIVTIYFVSLLIPKILAGNVITFGRDMIMGIGINFKADALSVFFAAISSVVGTIILLYSTGYMKNYENLKEYYVFVLAFIGSMLGLVFSANLILLYIFWELAAICSWKLIGFHRKETDLKAANKAFLITFGSSSFMLLGFIMIYMNSGTFNMDLLKGTQISTWAMIFIFIGIMGKSCVFPLHTWLPDAGIAPSPVTALLHAAVLVKIGIYAFARLFCQTFVISQVSRIDIALIALISAIIAGSAAFKENDIKRILAQSTISQLGLILAALALFTPYSITGALFFILAHAIGKAGLFLCAGIIEHNTKTKDITKLSGLIKNMPLTAFVFAICGLSVAGIPPMLGFWGKFFMIIAPIKAGNFWLAILFIICSILTLLYLLRWFNLVFLGKTSSHPDVREGTGMMLTAIVILAVLSIAGGIFASAPGSLVEITRTQLLSLK